MAVRAGRLFTPDCAGAAPPAHVPLTRTEAKLLGTLQQYPGTCLSRAFLLRTVWGYRHDTRTRTLDVYIRRLREKLGHEGLLHIKTVMGYGYLWMHEYPVEDVTTSSRSEAAPRV